MFSYALYYLFLYLAQKELKFKRGIKKYTFSFEIITNLQKNWNSCTKTLFFFFQNRLRARGRPIAPSTLDTVLFQQGKHTAKHLIKIRKLILIHYYFKLLRCQAGFLIVPIVSFISKNQKQALQLSHLFGLFQSRSFSVFP